MLLLYGKYLLCLTGTSWSSSVLRGRMGPRAVFSVEFSPRFGANLCSFTPADWPCPLTEGQLATGLSHGVLSFVVHHTRNSNMFSQRKMKGNLVWGMDFLRTPLVLFKQQSQSITRIAGTCMSVFLQAVTHCDMRNPFPARQEYNCYQVSLQLFLLFSFIPSRLGFFFSHYAYFGSWILSTEVYICDISLTSKHCGIGCPHSSHKEFLFLMSYDCDAKFWDNAFWL